MGGIVRSIGKLFGSGGSKTPALPQPTASIPSVVSKQAKGSYSSMLTSGEGVSDDAKVKTKSILGG